MQIIVRHMQGLGNQLFQYAAGVFFARKFGASLRLASDIERRQHSDGVPRPFLLSEFAIHEACSELTAFDRLCLSDRPALSILTASARAAFGVQIEAEPPDRIFQYHEPRLIPGKRRIYLTGYWQSKTFAETVAAQLRASLVLKRPLTGRDLEVATRIRQSANPVSVHLRRGDYAKAYPESLLPVAYYDRAMELIRSRCGDSNVFVFSDDPEFARSWATNHPACEVVGHNDTFSSYRDLHLMSLCRHHVIANSTFSWWGAWLGPHVDGMTVAPSLWVKGYRSEDTDLMPSGWTIIDS